MSGAEMHPVTAALVSEFAATATDGRRGGGFAGRTHTAEAREKIAAASRLRTGPKSDQGAARIRKGAQARAATAEGKANVARMHEALRAKYDPEANPDAAALRSARISAAVRASYARRRAAAAAKLAPPAAPVAALPVPTPVPVLAPVTTWRRTPAPIPLYCGIPCAGCTRPFDQRPAQLTRCDRCSGARHA